MKQVTWTDDPDDPCVLGVGVRCDICGPDCQEDWEHIDYHWFYANVDGTPITHMYRRYHPKCQAALDAYQAEVAGERF